MKAILVLVLAALLALVASQAPDSTHPAPVPSSTLYYGASTLSVTSEQGSLHSKYDEGKQIAELLISLIAKLQGQIQSETTNANTKITNRKAQISAFDQKIKDAETLINSLTSDINALTTKLNAAKSAKDAAVGARNAEQEAIEKENAATQSALANRIAQIEAEIALVRSILNQLTGAVYTTFSQTALLSPAQANSLAQALKEQGDTRPYELCWRASRDGYGSDVFHAKCNGKGATITIVKSTGGYLFGGYNPLSWTSAASYRQASNSFLFSLTRPGANTFMKLSTNSNNQYAMYDHQSYGPTFGGGHDIYVSSGCNGNQNSYLNLGYSYTVPGYTYGTDAIRLFLAGQYQFMCADVEVFFAK